MRFHRRQEPGNAPPAKPGAAPQGLGKQTLVAADLEGRGRDGDTAGKQTRVSAELEAFTVAAPLQCKGPTGGTGEHAMPPPSGGGSPLAPDVRTRMEAAFGTSFASVRVHQDPYAETIGAAAFTRGNDLFFAPGQFDPVS